MYIFDRAPSEVPDGAETASVRTVSLTDSSGSDVTFVGLDADSDHFGWDLPDSSPDHVHVSSSLALRRGLSKGDRLSLRTTDGSDHQVIVDGVLRYPGLAVFAQRDRANELFGDQPGAVNAAITDEADDALAAQARTVVDRSEMIRGADTLISLMGTTVHLILTASVVLFAIIMFLLMRMVVDKEQYSISLMKSLGYSEREAGRFFLGNFFLIVLAALVVGVPISFAAMKPLWQYLISSLPAAFEFVLPRSSVIAIVLIVLAAYALVRLAAGRRLSRVDVTEALKDRE